MPLLNQALAAGLNLLNPEKPLGSALHSAVIRLTPSMAIEAVALRKNGKQIEILLRQRGMDEPSDGGKWHCPGSFMRPGERLHDVFARLAKRECLGKVTNHELVDNLFVQDERAWICSAVYLVTVPDTPSCASWFPINQLPRPLVKHHRDLIIPKALEAYLAQ